MSMLFLVAEIADLQSHLHSAVTVHPVLIARRSPTSWMFESVYELNEGKFQSV